MYGISVTLRRYNLSWREEGQETGKDFGRNVEVELKLDWNGHSGQSK